MLVQLLDAAQHHGTYSEKDVDFPRDGKMTIEEGSVNLYLKKDGDKYNQSIVEGLWVLKMYSERQKLNALRVKLNLSDNVTSDEVMKCANRVFGNSGIEITIN